jgi:proline iminopeptidase
MPPIPPPRSSGYTSSTETPLYWAAYGPPGADRCLVIHGGPGAHHDYLLPQMLALSSRRELVFYDQRGGGRSRTDQREPITWQTHVRDLGDVARELAADPSTLVGYSWGGLLSLLYAIDSSHAGAPLPRRMVLIDPAPVSREFRRVFEAEFERRQRDPVIQSLRDDLSASGLRETDPAAHRQRAFELSVAGYFADPGSARDLTPFRVMGKHQQSVWESLGEYDLLAAGELDSVRVPALIVHGRQDPIPLASSEAAARALNAELVVLDRCGHVPYVERPAELFAAIEAFLASSDTG